MLRPPRQFVDREIGRNISQKIQQGKLKPLKRGREVTKAYELAERELDSMIQDISKAPGAVVNEIETHPPKIFLNTYEMAIDRLTGKHPTGRSAMKFALSNYRRNSFGPSDVMGNILETLERKDLVNTDLKTQTLHTALQSARAALATEVIVHAFAKRGIKTNRERVLDLVLTKSNGTIPIHADLSEKGVLRITFDSELRHVIHEIEKTIIPENKRNRTMHQKGIQDLAKKTHERMAEARQTLSNIQMTRQQRKEIMILARDAILKDDSSFLQAVRERGFKIGLKHAEKLMRERGVDPALIVLALRIQRPQEGGFERLNELFTRLRGLTPAEQKVFFEKELEPFRRPERATQPAVAPAPVVSSRAQPPAKKQNGERRSVQPPKPVPIPTARKPRDQRPFAKLIRAFRSALHSKKETPMPITFAKAIQDRLAEELSTKSVGQVGEGAVHDAVKAIFLFEFGSNVPGAAQMINVRRNVKIPKSVQYLFDPMLAELKREKYIDYNKDRVVTNPKKLIRWNYHHARS